jgi:hypothetical protein
MSPYNRERPIIDELKEKEPVTFLFENKIFVKWEP